MKNEHSVTELIHQLQTGESKAAQQVWDRFLTRLITLARHRLGGMPRRAADEEDVVLSAFAAFFQGVKDGRFARLDNRDDLWQVLVMLTERKAIAVLRKERAIKRGGGRTRGESVFARPNGNGSVCGGLAQEPDPSGPFVDQFTERLREFLNALQDDVLREMVLGRLAGYTNKELAAQTGLSLRAIERKLQRIRRTWNEEIEP